MSMDKIERITTTSGDQLNIISKGSVREFITLQKKDPEFRLFFDTLNYDSKFRQLMLSRGLIHILDIPVVGKTYIPILYQETRIKNEGEIAAIATEAKRDKIKGEITLEKIFESARPEIEELIVRFQERYNLMSNEMGVFSKMTSIIGGSDDNIKIGMFLQLGFSYIFERERLKRIKSMGEDFVMDDAIPICLSVAGVIKLDLLEAGRKHKQNILDNAGISEEIYNNIVKRLLVEIKVLNPFISIFWCENHLENPYSIYIVGHKISPDVRCPICQSPLSEGSFLFFSPNIMRSLRQSDGLLPIYVGYKLEKEDCAWADKVYIEGDKTDIEKDFLFKTSKMDGYGLIECKAFSGDVPQRTITSQLEGSLIQLKNQIEGYEKKMIRITKAYLVVNYDLSGLEKKELIDSILSDAKFAQLKKYNTRILGIDNIDTILEEKVKL